MLKLFQFVSRLIVLLLEYVFQKKLKLLNYERLFLKENLVAKRNHGYKEWEGNDGEKGKGKWVKRKFILRRCLSWGGGSNLQDDKVVTPMYKKGQETLPAWNRCAWSLFNKKRLSKVVSELEKKEELILLG